MLRRNLNITIIAIASLLAILTQIFMHPITIIFMVAFHIISLIYYRETAMIIAYHVMGIILITAYFVFGFGLVADPDIFLLMRFFVDAGGFAVIITMFIVVLQNKTEKGIEKTFIYTGVFYYMFYTFNRFQIMGYIETIYYPIQRNINNALGVFFVVNLVFLALNGLLQIYAIIRLDFRKRKRAFLKEKKAREIEQLFY